jgi:hypothetical protein
MDAFLKEILNLAQYVRDKKMMLLLGLLLIAYGLIGYFTRLPPALVIGLSLVAIYGPLLAVEAVLKRIRDRRGAFDDSQYQETMRKAQEAIDRSRKARG